MRAHALLDGFSGAVHSFLDEDLASRNLTRADYELNSSEISEERKEALARLPLDRVMLETDAPFMAPVPNRGKRCEPFFTREIAAKLAEIHSISFEKVAEREMLPKIRSLSLVYGKYSFK